MSDSERDAEAILRSAYRAFNARDIEGAIALMHPDVDWPNAWEGGRVIGRAGVRDYWRRQFAAISSVVEPEGFTAEPDGSITVAVHQVVHDARSGELILDARVRHRYRLEHGLVLRMDVLEPPDFCDDFDAPELDTEVWVPHYLPMWSSRAESAATYALARSELRLTIPPEQGLWCPGEHDPLRVSGIQSGVFSGAVGSAVGQQPFREGAVVREFQPAQWGWTPHYGLLEVRARMDLSPRSMAAVWMVGFEDLPERSAEICIFEVFGEALASETGRPTAAVGMGLHPFRDPAITDEFSAPRVSIEVGEPHVYAADWRPGRVDFLIDGQHLKSVHQAPDYPMQMMVAVFDFPARPDADRHRGHVPQLAVDYVRGTALQLSAT
jgi:ketosteroid isomerase-like protein